MQIREIMVKQVPTLRPTDSAMRIPPLLAAHCISILPVVDEREYLVGVVSRGDFLRYCLPNYVRFMDKTLYLEESSIFESIRRTAQAASVGELMNRQALTVGPDETVTRAVAVMLGAALHQLPVVEARKVVGLIGRDQVVNRFAQILDGEVRSP